MTSLVSLVAEYDVPELRENHLPMPHWAYGAIALAVFLSMLLFLWMFRHAAAGYGSDGSDPHAEGARGLSDHGQQGGRHGQGR